MGAGGRHRVQAADGRQSHQRRLLAAGRTIASAHRRVAALRAKHAASDARAHAAANRQIEREFGPSWGTAIHVRVRPVPRQTTSSGGRQPKAALRAGSSPRAIRAYKAPLRDARGRIALYFRIRYVGLKSKSWRSGLAADHALYILREQALEDDEIALDVAPLSNMGRIAACWRALEAVEEGYRANAKVQYRIIWNLPHDLEAEQRREIVEDFCERTFGRLGLPWVAAVHKADARGDQRNFHAHICFSTRPCERTGDHQWSIAQEKVNGLTNETGLRLMRALAAGHMNLACRDAGLAARFTHQTYRERGIDAERQEHVGPAAMAAHEAGEQVAVIERNAQRVEAAELAAGRDGTTRVLAATNRLIAVEQRRVEVERAVDRLLNRNAGARRIAALAQAMVSVVQRPSNLARPAHLSSSVATKARTMLASLKSRPLRKVPETVVPIVNSIGAGLRDSSEGRSRHGTGRAQLTMAQSLIAAIAAAQTRKAAADAIDRQARAKTIIMTATVPPYTLSAGKAATDFAALSVADLALVRELDRDTLVATLRLRIQRDLDEQAAARQRARGHQAQEERAQAERQAAQVRHDLVPMAARHEHIRAELNKAAREAVRCASPASLRHPAATLPSERTWKPVQPTPHTLPVSAGWPGRQTIARR